MTVAAALLLAACPALTPASVRDPAAASTYVAIGDSELDAGDADTARVAFAEALRLDPDNARARDGYARTCEHESDTPPPTDPLAEGIRLLDAGDPSAALEPLETARNKGIPGAALLVGIAHYELGEDAAATEALLDAERTADTAEQARLFLGLIALRTGDRATAAARFATARGSADPRIGAAADDLLKLSNREGTIVASVTVDPRADTNVGLDPDGTPSTERTQDLAAVAAASVSARPFGTASGLHLRANGLYRKQASVVDFDFGGAGASLAWDFTGPRLLGTAEYGFEAYALGGSPYLSAHRLLALGRFVVGDLTLGGSYRARLEAFSGDYAGYTGLRHSATLDASWRFARGTSVSAVWRGGLDLTSTASLTYRETGPWLSGTWSVASDVRLGLGLGALYRDFYASGDGTTRREDWNFDAELNAEFDVGANWIARAGLGGHRTASSWASATYTNLFLSVGVAWIWGGF